MIMKSLNTIFFQRTLQREIKRRIDGHNVRFDRSFYRGIDGSKIEISDRVLQALKNDEPVVALESTIITHGMPYPSNLETCLQVESLIKAQVSDPMKLTTFLKCPDCRTLLTPKSLE